MSEPNVKTDFYSPSFKVDINNQVLSTDEVISVEIEERIDKPSMFTLTLNERVDLDSQELHWLDKNRYVIMPGNSVWISFGYVNHISKFMGVIKAVSPGFTSSGIPGLRVEGFDLSHDLQSEKTGKTNTFKKMKYSDVAKAIAEWNLLSSAGVEDSGKKYPVVKRKKNEKDYAMLERLAKKLGYEFFVREDTLYFRPPKDQEKTKAASFEFRKNFISFNPRLTTSPTVHEVIVYGWTEKTKKRIKAAAKFSEIKSDLGIDDFENLIEKSKGRKTKKKIEGRVVKSKDEAKILAIAELKRANEGLITGSLECTGNPYLRQGMTVEIIITKPKSKSGKSVKNWFTGMYYIKGARHSLSDSGYTTTLDVRRCL